MTQKVPTFTLNNGVEIPAIGLGVFQSPPAQTIDAVRTALETGYRHIDTAAAYLNERQVGEGIRSSGLARDEVFIETKIWVSDYGYDETLHGFEKATAQARCGTARPAHPASTSRRHLRPHHRRLQGAGEAATRTGWCGRSG